MNRLDANEQPPSTGQRCKAASEYQRQYFQANRAKIVAKRKARKMQDPEAAKAARKKWRETAKAKGKHLTEEHKAKVAARNRAYYAANREKCKAKSQEWRDRNPERVKAQRREYHASHPEYCREWYAKNKTARNKWHNKYRKRREQENPQLAIYGKIVRNTNDALRKHLSGRRVTSRSRIVQLLGCEFAVFVAHIESQFLPGMTWENHGLTGWHFDHIMPLSAFDLTDEEQLKKGCHYTNVQPLWAADNIRKGGRVA